MNTTTVHRGIDSPSHLGCDCDQQLEPSDDQIDSAAGGEKMTAQVRLATELDQIERCALVMRELRASLTESEIVERIQEQRYEGYRLAFVEIKNTVVAVAGYRVLEHLDGCFVARVCDRAGNHRSINSQTDPPSPDVQKSMAYVDDRAGRCEEIVAD